MSLAPDLTSIYALANLPAYSYKWVPKKYRQEDTMSKTAQPKPKPAQEAQVSRTYSDEVKRRQIDMWNNQIHRRRDEEDLGQIIRKEYGPGEYMVQICERHPVSGGNLRITKTTHITVIQESPKKPSKTNKPKEPLAMLSPANKVAINPKPQNKSKPEAFDIFVAAVKGALFKKDVDEY